MAFAIRPHHSPHDRMSIHTLGLMLLLVAFAMMLSVELTTHRSPRVVDAVTSVR